MIAGEGPEITKKNQLWQAAFFAVKLDRVTLQEPYNRIFPARIQTPGMGQGPESADTALRPFTAPPGSFLFRTPPGYAIFIRKI